MPIVLLKANELNAVATWVVDAPTFFILDIIFDQYKAQTQQNIHLILIS